MIKYADDKDFEKETKSGNILIDFYAEWCGPCRSLSPIIEEIGNEENINIVKVNVDNSPLMVKKYGILSIPTLLLLENGQEKGKIIGLCTKDEIKKLIN